MDAFLAEITILSHENLLNTFIIVNFEKTCGSVSFKCFLTTCANIFKVENDLMAKIFFNIMWGH